MRYLLVAILTLHIAALPLAAQDEDSPSMMEQGMRQFFEGLLLEMEPAFDSMRGFMEEMGPALTDLMGQIDDWSVYETPEILENGDIIIRRKPESELPEENLPQIDL